MRKFVIVFAGLTLMGCQARLTGPSIDIEAEPVSIEVGKTADKSKGKGDFCPPGQAKKGRC